MAVVVRKEIGIGFLTGIIFNAVGVFLCVWILSMYRGIGLEDTFNQYVQSGNLWMLLSLGALPNLLAFFGFLRVNRDYRARGVLLATFLTAIAVYIIYFQ